MPACTSPFVQAPGGCTPLRAGGSHVWPCSSHRGAPEQLLKRSWPLLLFIVVDRSVLMSCGHHPAAALPAYRASPGTGYLAAAGTYRPHNSVTGSSRGTCSPAPAPTWPARLIPHAKTPMRPLVFKHVLPETHPLPHHFVSITSVCNRSSWRPARSGGRPTAP